MPMYIQPRNAFDAHGLYLASANECRWYCACGAHGTALDVNGAIRQHDAHKQAACEAEDDEGGTL